MAAQVILERAKFQSFLNSFGNNIEDILLEIKDNRVYGAVDTTTHYCSKSIGVMISADVKYMPGKVYISDVAKVLTFLKASSQDLCIVSQWEGALNLRTGQESLQLPSHTHIRSAESVPRALLGIAAMKESNYTMLGPVKLEVQGSINVSDIKGMNHAVKIAGKDAPCKIKVSSTDQELILTIGHVVGSANVNRVIDLNNVKGGEATTHFGSHLPQTLNCISDGMVDFYIGSNAALVLEHHEKDELLILKHQQGVNA